MSWPTPAQCKAAKRKLEGQRDSKIQQAIDLAVNEILGKLAGRYDVSSWNDDTPPALFTIAVEMAYGHAGRATHTGDRGTSSDGTAKDALTEAREMLKPYWTGSIVLLDSNNQVIAPISTPGSTFNRLNEPVFGMRDPITWGIDDVATPSRRLGGVDGFGVP